MTQHCVDTADMKNYPHALDMGFGYRRIVRYVIPCQNWIQCTGTAVYRYMEPETYLYKLVVLGYFVFGEFFLI